ncbi:MAG: sugar ABC transporter ATP-binding protein [Verrucomicrobia bacterium]|nr:sugar ABC transporter ATP-binding protein [Verrucomicrobiota bacterium]
MKSILPLDTATTVSGLAVSGLVKEFDGIRALNGVNLEVAPGTVHGLVGQNGAGKSTLIKILAGIYQPDAGTIRMNGAIHSRLNPPLAEKLGIQFIHQERLLVPTLTVAESLYLGAEPRVGSWINRRSMNEQAVTALQDYFGLAISPNKLIGELSAAQQQTIQITRALLRKTSILVLDEPTATLVKREVDLLFQTLQRLRDDGLTVIYISHYLNEIETLCDRVTVLRNGVDVATVEPRQTPMSAIVSLMIDRNIGDLFQKRSVTLGEPVLEVRELAHRNAFADVSFTIRQGEILGITGLIGSGAKEMVHSLFGLERISKGQVLIDRREVRLSAPSQAVRSRIAYVPEHRREHGVALSFSVRENMTLASLREHSKAGILIERSERRKVAELIAKLSLLAPSQDAPVRQLSGGNQQKVVLGKWLSRESALYILDEPTVGVDIGAKTEIYRLIGELAGQGAAILVLSSDLLELLGLADRILVFFRGKVVRELDASTADHDALLSAVTGVNDQKPDRAQKSTDYADYTDLVGQSRRVG